MAKFRAKKLAILYFPYPIGKLGRKMTRHSLGGSPLSGERLVRLLYLDEAGIGDPNIEPVTVVAGVIVEADKPVRLLIDHLAAMVTKYVPEHHQDGFLFHAKELVHGGKVFSREKDRELRHQILEELCSIPSQFRLPIVFGAFDRRRLATPTVADLLQGVKSKKLTSLAHAMAAYACVLQVEYFMQFCASPDEYASIIFEMNTDTRSMVDSLMAHLRKDENPILHSHLDQALMNGPVQPIRRIQEEHWFATKAQSTLLQLADVCAYILRRRVTYGTADESFSRYFDLLSPSLVDNKL